jgi:hypothetical protein
VPQLLRDNTGDSKVVEDVQSLAAAYSDDAVAESAEAMRQARVDDLALLAELVASRERSEIPLWRRAATQIVRYRNYSIAAVVILAILLFRSPVPLPAADRAEDNSTLLPTSDARHDAVATTPSTVPAFDFASSAPFDFAIPDDSFAPPVSEAPFETTDTTPTTVPVLRFSQTGYASTLAGTPFDQEPPGNGHPVETIAGRVTKYSYARLAGEGTVLRLKEVTGDNASISPEDARVQLCHITTAGWKPSRATPSGDAPKYDAACLEGHRSSGVWTFTFSDVFDPLDANGWAIVPFTAGNPTFRVTFAPTAA